MKHLVWTVAVLFTLNASCFAGESASCPDFPRFQLFQGQYTTYDLKKQQTYTHNAVFLLDTVTGQVKRYVNKIDEDGRYIESWVSTDLPAADKRK